jgi:hypothetical protein
MGAYTAGKSQDFSSRQTFLALCIALHVAIWGIGVYLYGAVLRVNPFEAPHLLIPVMGMLIGNSASGAALSVHRLRSEIESHKGEIEAALALGATPVKALEPYVAATMRNALIPSINSMMLMGIVQLRHDDRPDDRRNRAASGRSLPNHYYLYDCGSGGAFLLSDCQTGIPPFFHPAWGLVLP